MQVCVIQKSDNQFVNASSGKSSEPCISLLFVYPYITGIKGTGREIVSKKNGKKLEEKRGKSGDVVKRGGSLFTLQDLWHSASAVWHGSHRLAAEGSNIISSPSARCAM